MRDLAGPLVGADLKALGLDQHFGAVAATDALERIRSCAGNLRRMRELALPWRALRRLGFGRPCAEQRLPLCRTANCVIK